MQVGPVLAFYYSPWCSHCNSFVPVWSRLEQILLGSQISTVKIDIAETRDVNPHFEKVPTIVLTKNGRPLEFLGERTLDNILSFIQHN
jgi:thioredoxin-like negative regulator of GroEL